MNFFLKKHLVVFDELRSKIEEIHSIYTKYETATRILSNKFNNKKKTYERISNLMNDFNQHGRFFNIQLFGINQKVSNNTKQII